MNKTGNTFLPFYKPIYVMAKPVGSICNLACDYCYYLEKNLFYKDIRQHLMDEDLLERYIKEYIEAQMGPFVLFTWHGGEALMRPISFYKKALILQKRYAHGKRIDNCIQTNGTLLTDEWCKFFKDNNFLVGISIDGPKEIHDAYRHDNTGNPSHFNVMKGIELLKKHKVDYNGMAVINDLNVEDPDGFYNFFKSIECHFIQFAPIVERITEKKDGTKLTFPQAQQKNIQLTPYSIKPSKWGNFLCRLFDLWIQKDVGTYFIQLFDSTLANWVGQQPGSCIWAKECGHAAIMEFNGDIYSCDHFVFPEYKLGNLKTSSLVSMMFSEKQLNFGAAKFKFLPRQCKECTYLFACNGECPKNRFAQTAKGEYGLNYLCEGYYQYFEHVAPYMDFMKQELMHGRPPANIMNVINQLKHQRKRK